MMMMMLMQAREAVARVLRGHRLVRQRAVPAPRGQWLVPMPEQEQEQRQACDEPSNGSDTSTVTTRPHMLAETHTTSTVIHNGHRGRVRENNPLLPANLRTQGEGGPTAVWTGLAVTP